MPRKKPEMQYPITDWMKQANCRNVDVEIFFPEHHSNNMKQVMFAKEICSRCLVQAECLQFAMGCERDLNTKARYGIFGGMTPKERHRIRMKREDWNNG